MNLHYFPWSMQVDDIPLVVPSQQSRYVMTPVPSGLALAAMPVSFRIPSSTPCVDVPLAGIFLFSWLQNRLVTANF